MDMLGIFNNLPTLNNIYNFHKTDTNNIDI